MQRGDPLQNFSKWPIFLAERRKLQKIRDTCPIAAFLVWMDAEFILVSNDAKSAQTYWVLAEKWQFFQRVLKMADFRQHAKGDLSQNSQNGRFFWLTFGSFKK